jgi:hypothetical protein
MRKTKYEINSKLKDQNSKKQPVRGYFGCSIVQHVLLFNMFYCSKK